MKIIAHQEGFRVVLSLEFSYDRTLILSIRSPSSIQKGLRERPLSRQSIWVYRSIIIIQQLVFKQTFNSHTHQIYIATPHKFCSKMKMGSHFLTPYVLSIPRKWCHLVSGDFQKKKKTCWPSHSRFESHEVHRPQTGQKRGWSVVCEPGAIQSASGWVSRFFLFFENPWTPGGPTSLGLIFSNHRFVLPLQFPDQ